MPANCSMAAGAPMLARMLECGSRPDAGRVGPSRPEDSMAARLTTYVVVAIVAATLIAGLIVGAQRDDSSGPVDLIVFNAKVYPGDGGRMAEAVAIRGNQILRVGSDREIERLRRPQTLAVDAHGAAVLPGFNDADVRFVEGALALDAADLLGADSIAEAQARISNWSDANPGRRWIVGRGWSSGMLARELPTRQLLDAASGDRPAYMLSADGRTAWVNTKALRLAGVTRHTVNPDGGTIETDPRTGEPTGILKGAAVALASHALPPPDREQRARALRLAIATAHENGVTSVQDADVGADAFALYEEARLGGELNLRVYASIGVSGSTRPEDFRPLDALSQKYPDDPLFKVGGARIALDGPVDTSEAALLEPYTARAGPGAGETGIDPDELNRVVRMLDARGWQVTVDAYGDRAVRMALNAYDHAVRSNPKPERGRRHRIEHLALIDPEDLPRLGKLGVVALLRPLDAAPSPGRVEAWTRIVGEDRTAAAWPGASIAAAHTRLAFGTGWPGAAFSPLAAIHAAVTRATDVAPEETWNPGESVPLKRAIDGFTSVPAYASFDEQRKGSLKPGMLADLVVLSSDIFSAPASRLSSARVAVTIFDGKIVYRRHSTTTD
jgi:predicted amidohydrolase YtcJ